MICPRRRQESRSEVTPTKEGHASVRNHSSDGDRETAVELEERISVKVVGHIHCFACTRQVDRSFMIDLQKSTGERWARRVLGVMSCSCMECHSHADDFQRVCEENGHDPCVQSRLAWPTREREREMDVPEMDPARNLRAFVSWALVGIRICSRWLSIPDTVTGEGKHRT